MSRLLVVESFIFPGARGKAPMYFKPFLSYFFEIRGVQAWPALVYTIRLPVPDFQRKELERDRSHAHGVTGISSDCFKTRGLPSLFFRAFTAISASSVLAARDDPGMNTYEESPGSSLFLWRKLCLKRRGMFLSPSRSPLVISVLTSGISCSASSALLLQSRAAAYSSGGLSITCDTKTEALALLSSGIFTVKFLVSSACPVSNSYLNGMFASSAFLYFLPALIFRGGVLITDSLLHLFFPWRSCRVSRFVIGAR